MFLAPSIVKITHIWSFQYFSLSLLLPHWQHITTLHFTFQTIFIYHRNWSKKISRFTATDLEKWSISTLCFLCLCYMCSLLFIICWSFLVPQLFLAIRRLSTIISSLIDGPHIFVCHNNQGHCVLYPVQSHLFSSTLTRQIVNPPKCGMSEQLIQGNWWAELCLSNDHLWFIQGTSVCFEVFCYPRS